MKIFKACLLTAILVGLTVGILTWYITKINVEPEKVIITQEKQIIKYKYKLKEAEIKEAERFLIKIPFTEIGITKDFTLGTLFGFGVGSL